MSKKTRNCFRCGETASLKRVTNVKVDTIHGRVTKSAEVYKCSCSTQPILNIV